MNRVVHSKKDIFDVLIDRTTKWGNPFVLHRGSTKEERDVCIEKYKKWIVRQPDLLQSIQDGELRDKVLGCHCRPLRCHGDVLVELDEMAKVNDITLEDIEL